MAEARPEAAPPPATSPIKEEIKSVKIQIEQARGQLQESSQAEEEQTQRLLKIQTEVARKSLELKQKLKQATEVGQQQAMQIENLSQELCELKNQNAADDSESVEAKQAAEIVELRQKLRSAEEAAAASVSQDSGPLCSGSKCAVS
jgi:hypothetical protein